MLAVFPVVKQCFPKNHSCLQTEISWNLVAVPTDQRHPLNGLDCENWCSRADPSKWYTSHTAFFFSECPLLVLQLMRYPASHLATAFFSIVASYRWGNSATNWLRSHRTCWISRSFNSFPHKVLYERTSRFQWVKKRSGKMSLVRHNGE